MFFIKKVGSNKFLRCLRAGDGSSALEIGSELSGSRSGMWLWDCEWGCVRAWMGLADPPLIAARSSTNTEPSITAAISSGVIWIGPIDLLRPPGIPSSRIAEIRDLDFLLRNILISVERCLFVLRNYLFCSFRIRDIFSADSIDIDFAVFATSYTVYPLYIYTLFCCISIV